jgi:hypothetical protein
VLFHVVKHFNILWDWRVELIITVFEGGSLSVEFSSLVWSNSHWIFFYGNVHCPVRTRKYKNKMIFINREYILFCAGIASQEHTVAGTVEVYGMRPPFQYSNGRGSAATIDNLARYFYCYIFSFQVKNWLSVSPAKLSGLIILSLG